VRKAKAIAVEIAKLAKRIRAAAAVATYRHIYQPRALVDVWPAQGLTFGAPEQCEHLRGIKAVARRLPLKRRRNPPAAFWSRRRMPPWVAVPWSGVEVFRPR
jgi:hypothetical protein